MIEITNFGSAEREFIMASGEVVRNPTELDMMRDAYVTGCLTLEEFEMAAGEMLADGRADKPAMPGL